MKNVTIEKTIEANGSECGFCHTPIENGKQHEVCEKVGWFRGDDEYYSVHESCYSKKESEELNNQEKRMQEHAKFTEREDARKEKLWAMFRDNKIFVEDFGSGHLRLNDVIDWWEQTGTAIVLKTKKRYHFSTKRPHEIIKTVLSLTPQL